MPVLPLDPKLLNTLQQKITQVVVFPQVKTIIGEHWPQNAAQWSAITTIMGQFLLEIGLAFVPGSSILDVIDGVDEDNTWLVAAGIAGLIIDAFGGTILKAIGKAAKVVSKSFKIFKIVFRYLDTVTDAITLGYKTDLVNGAVTISNSIGNVIAKIQDNIIRLLTNTAKSLIKVGDLKLLEKITPTGNGFISAGKINNKTLRIDPQNSDYADDIADIIANGDPTGDITERIMQNLLHQDGYEAVSFPQLNGGQGFDNVLIKKDASGNITDVIINESKQVSNVGTIDLTSGVGCPGTPCTQMTTNWIQHTLNRMTTQGVNNQGENLAELASQIELFGVSNITQLVSGVNKNTGELVIANITGF